MLSKLLPRLAGLLAPAALLAAALLGTSGCAYQNEEELFASRTDANACDSTAVTYAGTIAPLLAQNCQRCHGPTRSEAAVKVTSYAEVRMLASTGVLLGTIRHQAGYPAMPAGAAKLSDCDINKVRSWVRAGMPNN